MNTEKPSMILGQVRVLLGVLLFIMLCLLHSKRADVRREDAASRARSGLALCGQQGTVFTLPGKAVLVPSAPLLCSTKLDSCPITGPNLLLLPTLHFIFVSLLPATIPEKKKKKAVKKPISLFGLF